MPNHVINSLVIGGDENEIKELMEFVLNKENEKHLFCFNNIIPMPPEDEIVLKNKIYNHLPNWYEWRVLNWGTKWDSYDNELTIIDPKNVLYEFQTAWSAPVPVIEILSKKYPKLKFSLNFASEDLGYNVGYLEIENGELSNEFYPEGENNGFEMAISLWGLKDEYELIDGKYIPIVSINEI